jgi:hypothetical protein
MSAATIATVIVRLAAQGHDRETVGLLALKLWYAHERAMQIMQTNDPAPVFEEPLIITVLLGYAIDAQDAPEGVRYGRDLAPLLHQVAELGVIQPNAPESMSIPDGAPF